MHSRRENQAVAFTAELGERARVVHVISRCADDELETGVRKDHGPRVRSVIIEDVVASDPCSQVAVTIQALAKQFQRERPAVVIVQGDTNSSVAAAQAAGYEEIPLIRIETRRSRHAPSAPEGANRSIIGRLADVHCAATPHHVDQLLKEGIEAHRIALTGSPIFDVALRALERGDGLIVRQFLLGQRPAGFVLATLHHAENTETKRDMRRVLLGFSGINAPSSSQYARARGQRSNASGSARTWMPSLSSTYRRMPSSRTSRSLPT